MTVIRNSKLEVLIAGNPSGPDHRWLDIAEHVLSSLDELETNAKAYLDHFVNNSPREGWYLEGTGFGTTEHDPYDMFTLYLIREHSDWYGYYHVTFRLASSPSDKHWPFAFGREEK